MSLQDYIDDKNRLEKQVKTLKDDLDICHKVLELKIQKLEKIGKLLHKINNMNPEDFTFYARTELRHCEEEILGENNE